MTKASAKTDPPHDDDDYSSSSSSSNEDEQTLLPHSSSTSSSDLKQHLLAVLIAIIASLLTFHHTTPHSLTALLPRSLSASSSLVPQHPYQREYRRTAGLIFCHHGDKVNETAVRSPLRPFDFRLPREFIPIMVRYYTEDEEAHRELYNDIDADHPEHDCLLNLQIVADDKKFVTGYAGAYITPSIETFYQLIRPKNERAGKKMNKAAVSFTGFAAKFYNLSNKPLVLYWDGGSGKNKERKVGEVKPFECIGTATFPGQSFRFAPLYDHSHALIRFIATADDAVMSYDPLATALQKSQPPPFVLDDQQQRHYDAVRLNLAFEKDYVIMTGRQWLATFPRPPPLHHMWEAGYFGQKHFVTTRETLFESVPEGLTELSYRHYRSVAVGANYQPLYSKHRRRMTEGGMNLTLKAISCAPRVFEIKHFLSQAEARHLIHLAQTQTLQESTVLSPSSTSTGTTDKTTRRSSNAWVPRDSDAVVDAIYRRAADVLKVDESLLRHRDAHERTELQTDHSVAESLQVVRYQEEEEYTPHHDFHHPPSVADRFQPVRFATLLIYLNDVNVKGGDGEVLLEGGETTFPRAITADSHSGVSVEPEVGKAVLFYNVLPDGNFDDLSQHAGGKVIRGEKWVANLWVWDPIIS